MAESDIGTFLSSNFDKIGIARAETYIDYSRWKDGLGISLTSP